MRTPLLVSIAGALALGACGHSLTSDNSGSGGAGSGGTGTGGAGLSGSGGTTGTLDALCSSLGAEYQDALDAAQSCDVGAAGGCAQLVNTSLSQCGSCQTYVNDATKLDAIRQSYEQAGCTKRPVPPCFDGACLAPTNKVCLAVDGGTHGRCTYVFNPGTGGSGATGGSSGSGGASGDGGAAGCGSLASDYAKALVAAKSCDPGASNPCSQPVPASLSPCSALSCVAYVNDATQLNAIHEQWQQAGCANVAVLCPAIACVKPSAGVCLPTDGGGSSCSVTYPLGALSP